MKLTAMLLGLAIALLIMFAGSPCCRTVCCTSPVKAAVRDMVSAGLRAWPTDQDFRGLVAEPAGFVRGTAVVFHGNAGPAGSAPSAPQQSPAGDCG